MKRATVVLLLLAACETSPPKAPPPPPTKPAPADPWARPKPNIAEIEATFDDFTRQVCACHDNACVANVTDARNRYGFEQQGNYDEADFKEADESHLAHLKKTQADFLACAQRILKPDPNAKPHAEEKLLEPAAALRDRMCACPDRACGQKVDAEMTHLMHDYLEMAREDSVAKRLKPIADAYGRCSLQLVTTGHP